MTLHNPNPTPEAAAAIGAAAAISTAIATPDRAEAWFEAQLEQASDNVQLLLGGYAHTTDGVRYFGLSAGSIIKLLQEFPEVVDAEALAEEATKIVNTADENQMTQFGLDILTLFVSEFGAYPPPQTPNGENAYEHAAYFAARLINNIFPVEGRAALALNLTVMLALAAG